MRYPRIYDVGLKPIGELRTAEITDLKIKQAPLSTVTVTVPAQDIGSFGYRQFVEIFDACGKRVDMFRVAQKPSGKVGGMVKLSCDQVLCTLKDDIVPGYVQMGGTTQNLRGAIQTVLGYQSVGHWELARCDYDTHFEYGLSDENLLSALLMLIEPLDSPMIVTDTTTMPWQLSVVRLTDEDASELRYTRNLTEIDEVIEDDGFATRLYPRGYGEGVNQLTIRDVNGGCEYIEAPQAVRDLWGTVSKSFVDTTCTDAATLKAKAETAMAVCQHPQVSYKVKGVDLHLLTGEPMDAFYAGRMARVIYTDYGISLRARVVEVHYPKPIAQPGEVNLTISSQSASVATVIAELARKSAIRDLYGQGSTFIYADSIEQNADKDTPAEGDIYIPETMVHVNAIMLKVALSAYRADSKGAAAGGGSARTTQAGGGSTQTSSSGGGSTQTSSSGGGGTRTSEAGGQETVTVPGRTLRLTQYTGRAVDVEALGTLTHTGYPVDPDALTTFKITTGAASGNTGMSAEQVTGVPRNADGPMTQTGSGGPTSTGSGGPTATGAARNADGVMSSTGEAGGHVHGGGSHRHGAGDTHRHTYDGISVGKTGYTSYNGAGSTTYTSVTTDEAGSHSHGMSHWHAMDAHTHSIGRHAHDMGHWHQLDGHTHTLGNHTHDMSHRHNMDHQHTMTHDHAIPAMTLEIPGHRHNVTIPEHTHDIVLPDHTHSVNIPAHTHDFTLNDHQHAIVYGIYKGPKASAFVVEVDGAVVPAQVFGSQGIGDIAPYLGTDSSGKIRRGTFHTLVIRPVAASGNPDGLCHIRASWNAQVFISSLFGKQY